MQEDERDICNCKILLVSTDEMTAVYSCIEVVSSHHSKYNYNYELERIKLQLIDHRVSL